jgi:hypothetical protein
MTLSLSNPRAKPRWLLLAAIVAICTLAIGSLVLASHSGVIDTIPSNYFTVEDQHGPNDVPGQVDLTQMGRDDSDPSKYQIFWSWDSISAWTGQGQTGDACALFDTNNDTLIDYAVCARVSNFNADPNDVRIVPKSASEPVYLFHCAAKNQKNDRCAGPVPMDSSSITAGPFPPAAANLVTHTDPFAAGEAHPHDTTIRVEIPTAAIPGNEVLTNVCSYPSAGNGGNNNPFDCIVTPGGGFIVIVKDAGTDVTSPNFTFDVHRGTTLVGQRTIAGSGTANEVSLLVGTGVARVTETNIPAPWALNSAECKLDNGNGAATGTFSSANNWVSGITVESGKITKCTFVDRQQTGTLVVKKIVINDNGGTKVASDFSFQVNGGSATAFGPDPDNSGNNLRGSSGNISLVAGSSFSVTEPAVAGYTTTYSGCSGTIAAGQTHTCTITNNDQAATLIVEKVVINDNGGTKVASDFSFQVNGGSATAFLPDPTNDSTSLNGKNTLTVSAGTYNITEPAVAGYTTTYNNCSNVQIANGGTATCTITNNDQAATLIVEKVVINDNGGTKVASDFSFQVNGGSATAFLPDPTNDSTSLNGKNTLTVSAGTYNITEPAVAGYTTTYNNCSNVQIANGGTATCTITNNDQKAQPAGTTVQHWVLHDTLNITGLRAGGGAATVTFKLYSDSDCENQVGTSEVVSLSGTSASTSTGVTVTQTGFYYWQAFYSGNSFNEHFETECGHEVTQIQAKDAAGGGRDDLVMNPPQPI